MIEKPCRFDSLQAVIAILFMNICQPAFAQEVSQAMELTPLASWSGQRSHIEEVGYFRVTSPQDCDELWHRHAGKDAEVPVVDFADCMVVAIFEGRDVNHGGVVIVSMTENDHQLTLRFDTSPYQTVVPIGSNKGVQQVAPYGIFVVRRSSKALVVEQDARHHMTSDTPVWKERIRFERL